jgi:Kef-type K+ transport system membrane component KefB
MVDKLASAGLFSNVNWFDLSITLLYWAAYLLGLFGFVVPRMIRAWQAKRRKAFAGWLVVFIVLFIIFTLIGTILRLPSVLQQ